MDVPNSRGDVTGESVRELKETSVEIIQYEAARKKKSEKNTKQNFRDQWENIDRPKVYAIGVPRQNRQEKKLISGRVQQGREQACQYKHKKWVINIDSLVLKN